MNLRIQGRLVRHTIKPIESGQYQGTQAGDVLVEIDNSYERQGQMVTVLDLIPFAVFKQSADRVLNDFKVGEMLDITFSLKGSSYNGRDYVKVRAAFIHHVKVAGNAGQGQQQPQQGGGGSYNGQTYGNTPGPGQQGGGGQGGGEYSGPEL